ncbi:acid phosphatase [Scheffersomyces stipitis CBS 6054]|uniref:Acid phosphatase n=1 Tax=Scheffersomyces stipitis (strain ATCC 58785 / CBS 6054 / NBRC 10063 / NRRL Y-11545) TaxID=322104 RepID=A3LWU6_PICST|nr:acid phosphatase [Scheffersomyces stipitis CBS 6054]ABN67338.1 acid phosphatase [Scheffersomyces stipitis CBS 6054]
MQFKTSLALFTIAATALAKTILLSNDDGWASTNIRATYYQLKSAGHDVYLVAPVSQRSGWGGEFDEPTSPTLDTDGEFGYVKAGAPSWGHEIDDDHIWYVNGTPASSVAFALKYVFPYYFAEKGENITVDLVVAGPNEGTNMSPGFFTASGTMGATYNAVYRGYPAISFSGSNSNNSFFKDSLDLEDKLEPSTIYANLVVEMVNQLFESQGENTRTLPLGVGLNVNFPAVGYLNETCNSPQWVYTRLTGEYAGGADMYYNETSNSFVWKPSTMSALSVCYNGDCSLPSENLILGYTDCATSVSAFSIDYDVTLGMSNEVTSLLQPLFSS